VSETITNLQTLPELVFSLLRSETIKVREENGVITILPIKKGSDSPIFGMFKGNGHIVDDFMAEKQREKELEI